MGRPKGSKNKPKSLPVAAEGTNLPATPADVARMTEVEQEKAVASIIEAAAMPVCAEVFAPDMDDSGEADSEEAVSLNLKKKYMRMTPEERERRQAIFLSTFRQTGRIDLACRAAGISYDTFRAWKEFGGRFRERWQIAKSVVVVLLKCRLTQISMRDERIPNGLALTAVMSQLNAFDPEEFRRGNTVEHNITIRDYRGFGK